jgi:hypothetical protein
MSADLLLRFHGSARAWCGVSCRVRPRRPSMCSQHCPVPCHGKWIRPGGPLPCHRHHLREPPTDRAVEQNRRISHLASHVLIFLFNNWERVEGGGGKKTLRVSSLPVGGGAGELLLLPVVVVYHPALEERKNPHSGICFPRLLEGPGIGGRGRGASADRDPSSLH